MLGRNVKVFAPIVLMLLAASVMAGEETWKGASLVDTMCSAKLNKDSADTHTTSCAIQCAKGGYGIYTSDGTYLKFDETGNKKTLALLKATKKTDHLRATVVGERDGETIKVKSLSLD